MKLRAALFDMDGTITRPLLDFPRIKRDMGLSPDSLILESLAAMSDQARVLAMEVLERHERLAAEASELNPGAVELLGGLHQRGLGTGIITRNSRLSVDTVFARHGLRFDVIISRDDAAPKPSPDGLQQALAALGTAPTEAVYVGDHAIDVAAGRAAGVHTIWLQNDHHPLPAGDQADWTAADLHEVLSIIEQFC